MKKLSKVEIKLAGALMLDKFVSDLDARSVEIFFRNREDFNLYLKTLNEPPKKRRYLVSKKTKSIEMLFRSEAETVRYVKYLDELFGFTCEDKEAEKCFNEVFEKLSAESAGKQ